MAHICLVLGFMVLAVSLLATPILAAIYTVGDSNGWALGVDYTTWASSKTFKVGDSLVFNYGSSHSVLEVGSSEYITCSKSNPLSADRSGATTITLNTLGQHYFVCGVPGHCQGGQKLEVTVSAAEDLGSPATAPPPSGNSVSSERPSIAANAPASTTSNDAHPYSSSAMSLSPIVASIFFIGIVVSTLIVLQPSVGFFYFSRIGSNCRIF